MNATEEVIGLICDSTPGITPQLLEAALSAAQNTQILFVQGEGGQVIDGKSEYPDYLQIQIGDVHDAMRLAQQLLNACADSIGNGGALRVPVTLSLAGQAILSE